MVLIILIVFILSVLAYYVSQWPRYEIIDGYNTINHIYGKFRLIEIQDFFTEEECARIINISDKYFNDVKTDYKRKNTELDNTADPSIDKISRILSLLSKQPIENHERLRISNYKTGGELPPHYDACREENDDSCIANNRGAGQRILSFLLYLNDDYEGGETCFDKIGLCIKPEKGKCIIFWNIDQEEKLIELSEHRGNKVLSGSKYIAVKWVHPRAYSKI
jgi:hypothetical protein